MQLVKLYDTSSVLSLQNHIAKKWNENGKHHSFSLLVKLGTQSFIKNSKAFTSVVSVQGKVMFKFTMILISFKRISEYCWVCQTSIFSLLRPAFPNPSSLVSVRKPSWTLWFCRVRINWIVHQNSTHCVPFMGKMMENLTWWLNKKIATMFVTEYHLILYLELNYYKAQWHSRWRSKL